MKQCGKSFDLVRKELLKSIHGNVLDFGSGAAEYLQYAANVRQSTLVTMRLIYTVHLFEFC